MVILPSPPTQVMVFCCQLQGGLQHSRTLGSPKSPETKAEAADTRSGVCLVRNFSGASQDDPWVSQGHNASVTSDALVTSSFSIK